jgi:hypothetical protein
MFPNKGEENKGSNLVIPILIGMAVNHHHSKA